MVNKGSTRLGQERAKLKGFAKELRKTNPGGWSVVLARTKSW